MDDISTKLREYFDSQGISQEDIAKRFGVTKQSINPIFTGKKPFGKKNAQKWADEFGISASWLLTGEGEMFEKSAENVDYPEGSSPCFDLATIQGGYGHGTGMEQITTEMAEQAVGRMLVPGLPTGSTIPYIQVRGNSMVNRRDPEHSIPEGAWIGITPSVSSTIRWGEVYALMTTDGPIVKKLMPSDKEGCIRCVSFNEEDGFLPFDLPTNEIITPIYNVLAVVTIKRWK